VELSRTDDIIFFKRILAEVSVKSYDIIPLWVQFYEVPDVSKHPNEKVNQGNTRENYTVIIIQ
jgi:hypothetical protein